MQHGVVKAEAFGIFDSVISADITQQPDRDQITGVNERFTQTGGSKELAAVVFGAPDILQPRIIKDYRGVVDNAGCGVAFFQGGGVDERFKAGAGLTSGLCYPVELIIKVIKATIQRSDCTIMRGQCNQCPFCFRQLGQLPVLTIPVFDSDDMTGLHHITHLFGHGTTAIGTEFLLRPFH